MIKEINPKHTAIIPYSFVKNIEPSKSGKSRCGNKKTARPPRTSRRPFNKKPTFKDYKA
jgi:hypothetical protein